MKDLEQYLDRIGVYGSVPYLEIKDLWRYMQGITDDEYDIPREHLNDYPCDFEIAHFSYSHPRSTRMEVKRIFTEAEFRETFSDWKLPAE